MAVDQDTSKPRAQLELQTEQTAMAIAYGEYAAVYKIRGELGRLGTPSWLKELAVPGFLEFYDKNRERFVVDAGVYLRVLAVAGFPPGPPPAR